MVVPAVVEGMVLALGLLDDLGWLVGQAVDDIGYVIANTLGPLDHRIRRRVLATLSTTHRSHRQALARAIVADPRTPYEDVSDMAVLLHHQHLPKLEAHGYVDYDARSGDVVLWKDPDEVMATLRSL